MSVQPIDDTVELIQRARGGDRQAFDTLFDRHSELLRRWASGRLPRWAREAVDTPDLVQDAVLQTLKHLDDFEPRGQGALQAYLRQSVINRIRNILRNAAVRPRRAEMDPRWADDGISPLEAAIGAETLEKYESALQQLSLDDREAVIGRIEMGFTYAELARASGKPSADAARMTVVRAIEKLAALISQSPLR